MKKLSIIRFKPKPECFDEFLENVRANSRESRTANPPTHYLMAHGDEIYAIAIRDADVLQEKASKVWNGSIPSATCCRSTMKWIGIRCR